MLLRVTRPSWLEIGAVIVPSYDGEGWRHSATLAVKHGHILPSWETTLP